MPYCCVITCKNHSGKTNVANSGISYHRFPANPDVKEKWTLATGRSHTAWLPQKNSTICSRHFEDHIIYMLGKSRRLPDDAIPTLNLPDRQNNISENENLDEKDYDDKNDLNNSGINNRSSYEQKTMQSALDRANKLIRKQTLLIKRLREQNRRDSRKIRLQNKVLNDLMKVFHLESEDIAVLRTEIMKSEEADSP